MAIPRFAVGTLASFLLFSCAGLAACTSSPPVQAAKADFNGNWSVQWCDKTDPDADCGGFDVDLTHVGDKISGEYFGARARLAQIDEGGVVRGIAIGNTAILRIESLRSGGIYLVEATIEGRCMHWKMRDTVRKRERDIDIIAGEDVLTKRSNVPSGSEPRQEIDCRGIPIRTPD
ncbi:hypothetical protein [Pseudoxanthomonas sp. Root65]|uniref:hypothetical protein n=1 Tax=Pseudoxanthomonas sp. Root65 TaxID=1736576 RepID=UPI0012E3D24B|nr:hypothetical protein [Pseudoxanthomonas sp. Root65]